MNIELFKKEDEIIVEALYTLLQNTDRTNKEKRAIILKLLERVHLTHQLYNNMYGR